MKTTRNYRHSLQHILVLFKQSLNGEEREYTSGSIDKAIFLLSIPMILEMLMESLFAVVDAYFVSRLGVDAVATVGLTESMLTIVYSLAIGLSMGTTAMVARRVGEKNWDEAKKAASQALTLGILLAIGVGIFGYFYSDELLRLMGASESVIATGNGYARWMFTGNITVLLLFLNNAIFRGAGNASLAMKSLILANGLNMLLDPLLIFGWGPIPAFGVTGAAMATNIGRGVGVAFQLYFLLKGSHRIKVIGKYMKPAWDIIWRLVKVSAGGTGQFLIASASWIFLVKIISHFGSDALAGYTIAIRIIVFAILPAWGMSNAAATLVGQNLGAGQPERAEKSVWRTAFFNMLFLGTLSVVFFTSADSFIRVFSTDELVVQYGKQCLQIVCLGYIFYAYGMVISQSFNGAGDTRTPTLINFFGFWLFQIPLAYLLAIVLNWGPFGAFVAISVAESSIALVSIYLFRQGKWKKTAI
ncbi:MATE family efflux transporter [Cytophagales bacterium LB-30]|uniref:Multidrug-efflux transporter n=1 Tax=Shiella aurantiaca TaxID=3058365 RepID=A0ABT8F5A4_9BACT|nr:MATE family efflux transporter [Shiella aurantiaca]MDN4165630.1 MATE family efflux transporter [Shiella aurantiaca]